MAESGWRKALGNDRAPRSKRISRHALKVGIDRLIWIVDEIERHTTKAHDRVVLHFGRGDARVLRPLLNWLVDPKRKAEQ